VSEAHRYVLLDVFTDKALEGNQLAVFPGAGELQARDMQRLARELNLSETVFLGPAQDGGEARVRIFTPATELPFAGHPVLGAAIVLGSELGLTHVTLETGAGPVPVALEPGTSSVSSGWMRQPIPSWQHYEHQRQLLAAIGVERSELPIELYVNGPQHVSVELASESAVAALTPDLHALEGLGELVISCFAGSGTSWKTRVFAPALGVAEDPATGSAAGPLAVHLARHRHIESGQQIEIRQGAEIGRPSLLCARVIGSPQAIERVEVGGSAVLVARGEFQLS
jgi:trans-2,3-dihydro-3-hydroxyanthranilate isomerase